MSGKSEKVPVVETVEIRPGRHVVKVMGVEFEVFVTPPPANLSTDELNKALENNRKDLKAHEDKLRMLMRAGKKVNDPDVVPIVRNAITEHILINLIIPILKLRGIAAGFEKRDGGKPDKRLNSLVEKERKAYRDERNTKALAIVLVLIMLGIALGFMIVNS